MVDNKNRCWKKAYFFVNNSIFIQHIGTHIQCRINEGIRHQFDTIVWWSVKWNAQLKRNYTEYTNNNTLFVVVAARARGWRIWPNWKIGTVDETQLIIVLIITTIIIFALHLCVCVCSAGDFGDIYVEYRWSNHLSKCYLYIIIERKNPAAAAAHLILNLDWRECGKLILVRESIEIASDITNNKHVAFWPSLCDDLQNDKQQ